MGWTRALVTWCGLTLAAVVWLATPSVLEARQDPGTPETVSIFFDCQTMGCFDLDYFRRQIPYVNWVRDREESDVHVLVTSQATGGGGRSYTLAFIGGGAFDGENRELSATTSGDATEDDRREVVARRLALGLVPYLTRTAVADRLVLDVPGTPEGPAAEAATPADDPWDYWVFQLGANGFFNGESTFRSRNTSFSTSANRTTEAWKLGLSGRWSRNRQEFDIDDETVVSERRDWSSDAFVVRSVGERWALGLRADVRSSSRFNQDVSVSLKPGVEVNAFPYSESSRRSLTAQYLIGPVHYDYTTETLFGELEETRLQHQLTAALALVQPWGTWNTSVTGSQFLHDRSKYSVNVFGGANVRLFRGFSFRIGGNYEWIRDQLYLPLEDATPEEILLRQRQLATNFRYFMSFGITYRFGSIFNNVVNPRFGGGEGFFFSF